MKSAIKLTLIPSATPYTRVVDLLHNCTTFVSQKFEFAQNLEENTNKRPKAFGEGCTE